jgi:hypothetical protein
MTLAELAQRSGRSIDEIARYALGGGGSPRAPSRPAANSTNGARKAKKASKPARSARGPSGAAVRRPSDRAAFDDAVMDAVRQLGGTAQSADIEKIVGGTPLQRRSALHRLVSKRKLTRSGAARGTTYTAR